MSAGPTLAAEPTCTLCGLHIAAAQGDDCPHCGAPARARSLPVLLRGPLADHPAPDLDESLPALVFAPGGVERKPLAERFARIQAVTLYGNYGEDVDTGVDVRDLSRFAEASFSAHLSVALFDYFLEQDVALAEAFRVLAPGGVFATLIVDGRVRADNAAPAVQHVIQRRPGYYDYWPDGIDLLSVAVGRDWLVAAMKRAGFVDARYVAIPDPASRYISHWFVGRKPEQSLLARTAASIGSFLRPRNPSEPPERIAALPTCTLCGTSLKSASTGEDCPSCHQPARLRGLPLVWSRVAHEGKRFRRPLLGFALSGAERPFLEPYFPLTVSVSLYGNYGTGHLTGVDVRDLSRFDAESFSCVFSILLFDYFTEHEQALAQIARVLQSGGLFVTAINPTRVSEGGEPPTIVKTIQPKPGYFDYVPAATPLPSVRVGSDWLVAAMERAGFTVRRFIVADMLAHDPTPWFVGIKR